MSAVMSAMERAVLACVANHHWPSFETDRVVVTRRENTGIGRFVDLVDLAEQSLPNGLFGAGESYIEIEGVALGPFFVVGVENSRLVDMELFTCEERWDGEERPWRLLASP